MRKEHLRYKHIYLSILIFFLIIMSSCLNGQSPSQYILVTPSQAVGTKVTADVSKIPVADLSPTALFNALPTATIEYPMSKTLADYGKIAYLKSNTINIIGARGNHLNEIKLDCIYCNSISWSPDGQWLAFSGYQSLSVASNVFIVKSDGNSIKQITTSSTPKINPTWSPNSKEIAYAEDTDTADIVKLNIESGMSYKITSTPGIESNPAWSPDGKYIAYIYRSKRSENGELWTIRSDGNDQQRITDIPIAIHQVSWSPNGKLIAFSSPHECGNVFTVDVVTHVLEKLTDIPVCASDPSWSPDGKSIVFIGKDYDPPNTAWLKEWQVYLVNVDSRQILKIDSGSEGEPFALAWEPVPALQVQKTYSISILGANLNIRKSHSLASKTIKMLSAGEIIQVLHGPVFEDGYYWWQISTNDNVEGWAAESFGWFTLIE